jgi:hypothetical protein
LQTINARRSVLALTALPLLTAALSTPALAQASTEEGKIYVLNSDNTLRE